jgi:hypothetical protein
MAGSTGCVSGPGIVGVDRQANQIFSIPSGQYREEILDVSGNRSLITLTENDAQRLVISKRDSLGQSIGETVLPVYFHAWYDPPCRALSPDGTSLGYIDGTEEVKWLDLKSGAVCSLLKTNKSAYVKGVFFCTTQSLIAIVHTFEGRVPQVFRLDVAGGVSLLHKRVGAGISDWTALPSQGLVAFAEDITPGTGLTVWLWSAAVNRDPQVVLMPDKGICTGLAISPDGRELCVAVSQRPETTIHIVNLATGNDRIVLSQRHESEYWRNPAFMGTDLLALIRSDFRKRGTRQNDLEIYDLQSGSLRAKTKFWNIANMHSTPDGSRLIMEVN